MLTPTKNLFMLSARYHVLLICIAVLAVYYPTLYAEVCLLDDQGMISTLFNIQDFDIKRLFFPGSAGGGYYRPFIGLSFYFDRFAWLLSPEIMHFENILLHLLNSLLVFGICSHLSIQLSNPPAIPLLTALFFALHPVNSESVNWISGRTDLLAGFFVLSAAFILVRYNRNTLILLPAVFLVILGALAKETALAFLPGIFFLFRGVRAGGVLLKDDPTSSRTIKVVAAGTIISLFSAIAFYNFIAVVVIAIATLLLIAQQRGAFNKNIPGINVQLFFLSTLLSGCFLFWGFRRLAYTSDMPRIASALKLMTADVNTTLQFFLGAMGYYLKKMIWPLPLDFTILEIDPLYSLFGILLLFLSVYLLLHSSVVSGLFLASFCMLIPALPLSIGKIAWTPYAERYVYLGLPFLLIAITSLISPVIKIRLVFSIILLGLVVFTINTVQRNFVWQKNLTLFADVVEKNPNFKPGRGLYMVALYNQKLFDKAAEQYYAAQTLPSVIYDEEFDLIMASMLAEQKKFQEAEMIYMTAFNKTKGKNPKVVNTIISFYLAENSRALTAVEKGKAVNKILAYLVILRNIDKSSTGLYRAGQVYLAIDKKDQARAAFEEARKKLKSSDPLMSNIDKLLIGLNKSKILGSKDEM